ncbi:MAG: hypothetical protein HC902_02030 [Calothrix sp. SM1_5_4]|nr:hypothetical protein [Calothrix sp. SM1_5_4]
MRKFTPSGTSSELTLKIYIDKNNDGSVNSGDSEATEVRFKVLAPPANYDVYGETGGVTQGIGAFSPYPGDEKVRIEQIDAAETFATLTYGGITSKATKVRVFISDQNMTSAHVESGIEHEDLNVVESGAYVDKDVVDGLENGTRYFFRVALVDEGQNVLQYFPAADACTTGAPEDCAYSAVPDEVLGLLSDDVNCFIATAAYGSGLEPKLKTFRDFRHRFLLTSEWGARVRFALLRTRSQGGAVHSGQALAQNHRPRAPLAGLRLQLRGPEDRLYFRRIRLFHRDLPSGRAALVRGEEMVPP